jgi:hypothetical protein
VKVEKWNVIAKQETLFSREGCLLFFKEKGEEK